MEKTFFAKTSFVLGICFILYPYFGIYTIERMWHHLNFFTFYFNEIYLPYNITSSVIGIALIIFSFIFAKKKPN